MEKHTDIGVPQAQFRVSRDPATATYQQMCQQTLLKDQHRLLKPQEPQVSFEKYVVVGTQLQ